MSLSIEDFEELMRMNASKIQSLLQEKAEAMDAQLSTLQEQLSTKDGQIRRLRLDLSDMEVARVRSRSTAAEKDARISELHDSFVSVTTPRIKPRLQHPN